MGYSGPIETLGATRTGDAQTEAVDRRLVWRRRLLFGFFLLLVVAASAYGVRLFNDHIRYVATDDAYVDAQLAEIAPQIDGSIAQVMRKAAVRQSADLMVIGRGHANAPLSRLRSNAHAIIRNASCPVLSV